VKYFPYMKRMIVCERGQRNFKIYDEDMVFEQLVRGHRKPVLSGDVCVMCGMCVMYVFVCVKCV